MVYCPSLRTRLIHLVLLAILPALALILYSAREQQIKDSQDAKREALRLVRLVAASQQRVLDSTRHLLIALARLPEVGGQDGPRCSALFAGLLKEYPLYANLGAADAQGEQFCSARPPAGNVNISDQSYFRRAFQRKDFAIGNYQVGGANGKASLNLGLPIFADDGSVLGVVFAAVDLEFFNQVIGTAKLPDYASIAVYDHEGTILARSPDDEGLVGRSVPQSGIVKTTLALGEGVAQTFGLDGKERLYGFTSIGGESNSNRIFLHIGIPADAALADAKRLLQRNLAALILVSVLALVAAWYGGDLFILRQLGALIRTAERLGSGDLAARTGLLHERDEIGKLAASFDEMAASLELKQRETEAASARLARHLDRIKAQHDIYMAITSTLDLRAMLALLLEKVDLILPGAVTTIRLINRETGTLEPVACRNVDEGAWKAGNPRPMHGFAKIVLDNKIPLAVANVQTDPRNDGHRFALRFGLVSYLGIPLISKDQVLGLIAFYTKEEHFFSNEEIEFLTTLARQSAIAIHNATLYEEIRRNAGELSALHSLATAATQSLDLDAILASAIEKVTSIFHFDATRIFLFDGEMSELRVAAAFEAQPELWTKVSRFQRGQGIVGKVAESGESLIFEDIAGDLRYAELSHSKVLQHAGANFFAALPIATKLKTWGVAVFVGKRPRRLLPHEVRLLNSMTHQIGIAVENATLYSQTAAKAKELSALYSIAGIASESLDINTVLRKTMEKVLEIFNFDAARIYLRSDDDGELHLAAHEGIPAGVPLVAQYKSGQGRLGKALESGDATFVEDMATDPDYIKSSHNKHMLNAGFRSSFIIPLKIRRESLGVMNFLARRPYHFSQSDIQLINAIAYHLGVSVGNARLFFQLKKKTVELERASQGKDEFLGVISHELRTPLNVIRGYTEIMMQQILGDLTEEQRRAMETISSQSRELLNMINGVLQVTRIEAGAVLAAAWEVNLGSLLDELQRNYSIPTGKDLILSWDYPNDLPVLLADGEKLKAIVQNLVNNAIKFTEHGKVAIGVRHLVASKEIEFSIADTGIGIPNEKIKTIFGMFQQGDSSATRNFGGVGLGLYIVRKYTELLGGRVSVESKVGHGSVFIVRLPANISQPATTIPTRKHHAA